ncbi:MAG: HEAT repeat domain-containing protein, partial [Lentisphaeria bacterium]|nr:HEAT repeat domain-containing protein [Lentisphaeria bacterium]
VTRNDDLLLGLLQFISDVASLSVIDRVIAWLNHPAPDIRAAAANTLSRLGGDAALQALLKRIRKEPVAETQKHIAEALARWPDDPKAGAACLQLFNRTNVPDVRRAVLVSAGNSNWPQRSGLIRRAMQMQGAVVVGVNAKPVPGLEDVLLGILKKSAGKHLKPALIDALATARIAAATPALVQMLAREKNVGMRLKLIFALERIGGNAARDALGELLSSAKDELEIEYLINAVGHVKCVAALPYLARLAKDRSAPLSARAQALWGLGCMPDPRARAELEAIRKNFTKHFGQFSDRAVNHDTEYHMLIVKPQLLLALYRTGSTTAEREIHRLYRESGPMGQTVLLSGIKEQKADHPIIADGLKSNEFAVLYFAIAAARATGSRTYVPRLRQLAGSPFLRSISGLGNESWGLYDLLLNDLLKEAL